MTDFKAKMHQIRLRLMEFHPDPVGKAYSYSACRVLSLSDCRYSLNPLSQTRIDWV